MRMIDADELKNQIRHMPRTINPDLVQYSLVQAIIADMPTLTPPNEWVAEYGVCKKTIMDAVKGKSWKCVNYLPAPPAKEDQK